MIRWIALLLCVCPSAGEDPVPVLLVTGSHTHDWVNTTPVLSKILSDSGRFKVTVTEDPAKDLTPQTLAGVRLIVLHYRQTDKPAKYEILDEKGLKTPQVREVPPHPNRWPEAAERALLAAVHDGAGCVALHYGTSAFDEPQASWPEYENLIGGGWRASKKQYGHGTMYQFKVKLIDREHPITRGMPAEFLHAKDELYHKSLLLEGSRVLVTAFDDPEKGGKPCTGKDENLAWVREYGKGRVFTFMLGHGPEQMRRSPGFQTLFARGCEWAATGAVTIPIPEPLDAEPLK
jgi:type 1 glutamine amidotransferase